MTSPTERDDGHSLEAHRELVDWIISHGGQINDCVRVAQDESRGVHIQVKKDWAQPISKETRVLSTPLPVTMSYFNAIGLELPEISFSKHDVDLPRGFIDAVGPEETSTFFLMGQFLRGPRSFWYPYLRTLPQPGQMTTPLFFDEEDVDWLQGTGIPEAAAQRYQIWDEKYENCMSKLEELGFTGLEEYSWDLYLWASTILSSRAFSPKVLSSVIDPSRITEDSGVSVLLPLIDLPNHRPLAKVEWRAGSKDIGMVVLEEISPGEEISNNYGPRNNEQLLMNYGFCLTNNSTDYRVVKLGVKPDSPLSQAKERQMQMFPEVAKNIEDHYYIFNVFYPLLAPNTAMEHSIFSPALFNALAIMHANERERKTMEITEFSISIPTAYGSGHSTLAVLSQISFELIAHLMILRASAEDLPTQPANLKQTFAQVYRHGQIAMDKAALVIATWTLARAREHVRGETWDDVKSLLNEHLAKIPEGSFSAETLSRIQLRILERESLVKKNGELFRLGELYGLLPAEMQDASRACFNHVLEQAGQHIPMLQTDPQALFALVLSLLIATSRSSQARPQLSTRLTHWVDFLVDQYPPSSLAAESGSSETMEQLIGFAGEAEAYNWAVQDGAVWLSEETGWLNADWLRWAVKVVDMEMVLIPLEPLQVLEADNPGMPKLGCLYVPQE